MLLKVHRIIIFFLSSVLLCSSEKTGFIADLTSRSLDQTKPNQISIGLQNAQNKGYYLTVKVGESSNDQYFTLKVDIGSPWVWIPDMQCTNCLRSNDFSQYYDCSDNPTTCNQDRTKNYTLDYLEGNITGFVGLDSITIGNFPDIYLLSDCPMYYATSITENFYGMQADGIIGLGRDRSNKRISSLLDVFQKAGLIKDRVFATFLTDDFVAIDQESTITFGGYEEKYLHQGEAFSYIPTVLPDGWSIGIQSLNIGLTSLVTTSGVEANIAILSTVFPDIGVPPGFIDDIIGSFKQLNILCSMLEGSPNPVCRGTLEDLDNNILPNITMVFGDTTLVLPPQAYTVFLRGDEFLDADNNDYRIVLQFRELSSDISAGEDYKTWVFGASFLRYFYILYDEDNKRVGFAKANHEIISLKQSNAWFYIMVIGISAFLTFSCCIMAILVSRKVMKLKNAKPKDEFNNTTADSSPYLYSKI